MKQSLLITIDVLLDTRLGAMSQVSDDMRSKVINDPKRRYWKRVIDDFDEVAGQGMTFLAMNQYKNRNVETLKVSFPTEMLVELNFIALKMIAALIGDPLVDNIEIVINTHPYVDLTPEEKEGIMNALRFHMEEPIPIRCVSRSLEELTLADIRANWEMVFLYDFADWWKIHHATFASGDCIRAPQHKMVAPALFHGSLPTRQDLMVDGVQIDPFDIIRMDMAEFIGLEFWDAQYFSLIGQGVGAAKEKK